MCVTKSERTRRLIVEKTAPIFNSKGFEGTTLQDLTKATKLTKGALYGNFNNKEQIATEAFKHSIERVRNAVGQKLAPHNSSRKKLLALVDFYAEYVFAPPVPGGCPLLNFSVDCDDQHPFLRKVVAREVFGVVESIRDMIDEGIDKGEFKKTTDAKRVAYVLFCVIEGGVMFSRIERSDDPMKIVVKHCKDLIHQISN